METNMEDVNELFYGNLSYQNKKESNNLIPEFNTIVKKFTSEGYMFPNYMQSLAETYYLRHSIRRKPQTLSTGSRFIRVLKRGY